MRIVGDPRRRGEAAIVVRHEGREEGLGGGRGGETPEAQLLDEAILERAVARSTRPFACGLLAQRLSMLRSRRARPNCESPGPPWARSRAWTLPAALIQPRSVSTDRTRACSSVSFWWANVGPKSA